MGQSLPLHHLRLAHSGSLPPLGHPTTLARRSHRVPAFDFVCCNELPNVSQLHLQLPRVSLTACKVTGCGRTVPMGQCQGIRLELKRWLGAFVKAAAVRSRCCPRRLKALSHVQCFELSFCLLIPAPHAVAF